MALALAEVLDRPGTAPADWTPPAEDLHARRMRRGKNLMALSDILRQLPGLPHLKSVLEIEKIDELIFRAMPIGLGTVFDGLRKAFAKQGVTVRTYGDIMDKALMTKDEMHVFGCGCNFSKMTCAEASNRLRHVALGNGQPASTYDI